MLILADLLIYCKAWCDFNDPKFIFWLNAKQAPVLHSLSQNDTWLLSQYAYVWVLCVGGYVCVCALTTTVEVLRYFFTSTNSWVNHSLKIWLGAYFICTLHCNILLLLWLLLLCWLLLLVLIRSVLLIRSTFKAPNQKLPRRPECVRNLQKLQWLHSVQHAHGKVRKIAFP